MFPYQWVSFILILRSSKEFLKTNLRRKFRIFENYKKPMNILQINDNLWENKQKLQRI